jgi:hypothetical protein
MTLSLALLLAACGPTTIRWDDECPVDTGGDPIDLDDDGALAPWDCDDTDPAVRPGAEESCNHIDDDCDGIVDEDAVDAFDAWADVDEDGWGGDLVLACELSSDVATAPGDCDDADPDVHPDALEQCNGVDDDCDGVIDPDGSAGALPWYADTDADGFGDAALLRTSCEVPGGYLADASDCDDADAAVNPAALEVCRNAVDENCDGVLTGCGSDLSILDAGGTIIGDDDSAWSAVPAGDQDGDGYDDVFVGAYNIGADDGSWTGGAYLMSGPIVGEVSVADATAQLFGDPGEMLGSQPQNIGDFDGDGATDFLLGAAASLDLIFGPITTSFVVSSVSTTLTSPEPSYLLGAGAGDVDGDGFDDLIVGGRRLGTALGGIVYLLDGPARATDLEDAEGVIVGMAGEGAGVSVSGAGDVDGDGFDDVLVGSRGSSDRDGDGHLDGLTTFWSGPITGTWALADATARLEDGHYGARTSSPAGDVDADGYADIFVNNPVYDETRGRTYLVRGPIIGEVDLLAAADATLVGAAPGDNASASANRAGDLNGDGFDDIVLSAPVEATGGSRAGATYVLYSPVAGVVSLDEADFRVIGTEGSLSGYAVNGGGDIDGDGLLDLMIGIGADARGGPNAGAVAVVYGNQL